jgi:hypothetical protein
LTREGHDPALAAVLFTGMIERVVALVSRVQGTYEFEVQPLREYFAARFLSETAPYSPLAMNEKEPNPTDSMFLRRTSIGRMSLASMPDALARESY